MGFYLQLFVITTVTTVIKESNTLKILTTLKIAFPLEVALIRLLHSFCPTEIFYSMK